MNPEQSKALPELEKIYASCFDNAREDVDVQHERGLMAIYNAGKASAVAVKVEACAREICSREDWASVTRDGVEEIILRHLTDESEEVRRLRNENAVLRKMAEVKDLRLAFQDTRIRRAIEYRRRDQKERKS